MYEKELNSLKKANRFRKRELFNKNLLDLASNDYLGLAQNKNLLKASYEELLQEDYFAPKSSLLVNGYHQIHKNFEDLLCQINGFESAICLGSGFLANLSLIEALCRKNDTIFIDEEFHASGILSSKVLKKEQVIYFLHNDINDLENKLQNCNKKGRKIILIEGVYSMNGNIAKKDFYTLANSYEALLIVDEAHSSGVIGDNLKGYFDYHKIKPLQNHIKMGTLGKAYGSYGAYILASKQIISFLENRAKPIIYSTAPSLFDINLAKHNLKYIMENKVSLRQKINKNLNIIEKILNLKAKSLIIPIKYKDNKKVIQVQNILKEKNILVGAIRQPTVKTPIIRLIAKIDIEKKDLEYTCTLLKDLK